MRRLYVHAGPHKTGTTSIQAMLSREAPRLRSLDLHVYREGGSGAGSANASGLAHAFIRDEVATPMRLLGRQPPRPGGPDDPVAQDFAVWCKTVPEGDGVVSAEAFSFLRTPQEVESVTRFLLPLVAEVVPILVLRGEAGWRRSLLAQLERMGIAEHANARAEEERPTGDWYFDRESLIETWSGIGSLRLIDYEAAVGREGSILPAFVRALDRPDFRPATDHRLNVTAQKEHLP